MHNSIVNGALAPPPAVPSDSWFRPARQRGHEHLDDPRTAGGALVLRELRDVARSNALFGGTSAVVVEVLDALETLPASAAPVLLLDVGTGIGDIPRAAGVAAARRGIRLQSCGVELSEAAAGAARGTATYAVCADAFHLPFADRSMALVTCSQVLHHFDGAPAIALLRELNRVASHRVIVSEIRRSWLAAAGVWLASWPLGFHRHSREDGVTSVLRGFTAAELDALARSAVGTSVRALHRAGWRVTASWTPVPLT